MLGGYPIDEPAIQTPPLLSVKTSVVGTRTRIDTGLICCQKTPSYNSTPPQMSNTLPSGPAANARALVTGQPSDGPRILVPLNSAGILCSPTSCSSVSIICSVAFCRTPVS